MPFRDVAGHRSLLGLLARTVSRDTLPPTLLFAGPEGVGKRRVAVALAQAINCEAPVRTPPSRKLTDDGLELDACGSCPSCQRIERGVHGDVLLIQPGETGAIKIEQAREIVDRASYRPFEGRMRIVIIDEADTLVRQAQNALLKTLEEPPPGSVFILVSSRPDVLLPTVRSRCPQLRFGRLRATEVAELLVQDHGYAETDARAAAANADGSPGRALRVHSGDLARAREGASRSLQGAAATANPKRRLDFAKDLVVKKDVAATEREALALRLHAMTSLLRDVGLVNSRADHAAIANADLRSDLTRLAADYDGDRVLHAFSAVDRALGALTVRNASPKIVADWLMLQL